MIGDYSSSLQSLLSNICTTFNCILYKHRAYYLRFSQEQARLAKDEASLPLKIQVEFPQKSRLTTQKSHAIMKTLSRLLTQHSTVSKATPITQKLTFTLVKDSILPITAPKKLRILLA